jgi:hypothetical protein
MKTGSISRRGRDIETKAVFSPGGCYRYRLERDWSGSDLFAEKKSVLFIMLNPSTASEDKDDPTIRRCQDFAQAWGFSRLIVCNLFSYCATKPQVMIGQADPVGPQNDEYIMQASREVSLIIVAWGKKGNHLDRADRVLKMLWAAELKIHCLRVNGDLSPEHPLYLPAKLNPALYLPF